VTLHGLYAKFPSIDCGACFTPTCRSFARRCLLDLNTPFECPVLGWVEGGLGAKEADDAVKAYRGVEVPSEAKVIGTPFSLYHSSSEGKVADFVDMATFIELAETARVFDATKPFLGLEAVLLSGVTRSLLVVSDGRILPTGPGPPSGLALSSLSNLMWGAVNHVWPILPAERHDSDRVCVGWVQGVLGADRRKEVLPGRVKRATNSGGERQPSREIEADGFQPA
jgi:hypothetical protein